MKNFDPVTRPDMAAKYTVKEWQVFEIKLVGGGCMLEGCERCRNTDTSNSLTYNPSGTHSLILEVKLVDHEHPRKKAQQLHITSESLLEAATQVAGHPILAIGEVAKSIVSDPNFLKVQDELKAVLRKK